MIRLLKSLERYRHSSPLRDIEVNKIDLDTYLLSFSGWAAGTWAVSAVYSWLHI